MTDEKPVEHVLSASLKPADAPAGRDALLGALTKAREAAAPLELELDGDDPLPCSLQLLVAAERSAEAAAVPLHFGPRARSARDTLSIQQSMEQEVK